MTIQEITRQVEKESIVLRQITAEVAKVVVGQRNLVDRMLIGLLKEQYAIRILYDKQKVV
jgi:MoxR-like ATPase